MAKVIVAVMDARDVAKQAKAKQGKEPGKAERDFQASQW